MRKVGSVQREPTISQASRVVCSLAVAAVVAATGAPVWADGGQMVAGVEAGLFQPLVSQSEINEIDVKTAVGYGVRFGYGLSDQATIALGFARAESEADLGHGKRVDLTSDQVLVGLDWSVTNTTLRPQILGAVSYEMLRSDRPMEDDSSFGLAAGVGLMGVISPYLHAGVRARYHYQLPENLESVQILTVVGALDVWF